MVTKKLSDGQGEQIMFHVGEIRHQVETPPGRYLAEAISGYMIITKRLTLQGYDMTEFHQSVRDVTQRINWQGASIPITKI